MQVVSLTSFIFFLGKLWEVSTCHCFFFVVAAAAVAAVARSLAADGEKLFWPRKKEKNRKEENGDDCFQCKKNTLLKSEKEILQMHLISLNFV